MSTELEVNKWLIHDWPNIVMAKQFGILDKVLEIEEKK